MGTSRWRRPKKGSVLRVRSLHTPVPMTTLPAAVFIAFCQAQLAPRRAWNLLAILRHAQAVVELTFQVCGTSAEEGPYLAFSNQADILSSKVNMNSRSISSLQQVEGGFALHISILVSAPNCGCIPRLPRGVDINLKTWPSFQVMNPRILVISTTTSLVGHSDSGNFYN